MRSMTRMQKIAGLIAVLFMLGLAVSWAMGSAMVRPQASEVPPAVMPARDLTLTTTDGVGIAATYWPGRRSTSPAILLLHGNGASRWHVAGNAAWLAKQGFAVMTIDFRGHGESAQLPRSFGLFESRDAAAAFAWLKRTRPGTKIGIVGISLGGASSLLGAQGPLPADALVLQAVYPDIRHAVRNRIGALATTIPAYALEPLLSFQSRPRFGVWPGAISPLTAVRRYRGPLLVIGGGADLYTPPEESWALYAVAPGQKELWTIDGLDQAAVSGIETLDYRQHLLAFFAKHLGDPRAL